MTFERRKVTTLLIGRAGPLIGAPTRRSFGLPVRVVGRLDRSDDARVASAESGDLGDHVLF
jgi:hypothetical protein